MASEVAKRQVHMERQTQERRRSTLKQRQQASSKRRTDVATPTQSAVPPISPTAGTTMLSLPTQPSPSPSPSPLANTAKRGEDNKLQSEHCTWAACVANCYRSYGKYGSSSDPSSITVHQTFLNDLCARERISARLKRLTGKSSHELLLNSTSRTSNATLKSNSKSEKCTNNNSNKNNNNSCSFAAASTRRQKQVRQIVRSDPRNDFLTKLPRKPTYIQLNREQKVANDLIVNIDHVTHKRYPRDKCLPSPPPTSKPSVNAKSSLAISAAATVRPKHCIAMNIADDEHVVSAFVHDVLNDILAFAIGPQSP